MFLSTANWRLRTHVAVVLVAVAVLPLLLVAVVPALVVFSCPSPVWVARVGALSARVALAAAVVAALEVPCA